MLIMQNYIDNANGDVPLTVENVRYFHLPLRSRCAQVLLERKTKLINRFLYKKSNDNASQMSQLTRGHM